MMFSKSFGYALRGILYVATMSDESRKIRIDEMAKRLEIPRHFLGKVMNKVAKENILTSTKGPSGGFSVNKTTLNTNLIIVLHLTDGNEILEGCALHSKKCDMGEPCALHEKIKEQKESIINMFSTTTIADLLKEEKPDLVRNLSI